MLDGVEVRALCRPVKFFHIKLNKTFLLKPGFVNRGTVILKQERVLPKLSPQLAQSMKTSEKQTKSTQTYADKCPYTFGHIALMLPQDSLLIFVIYNRSSCIFAVLFDISCAVIESKKIICRLIDNEK